MKKYLSIVIAGLSFTAVQSQDVSDALRYAQDNLNGTARFRAMSGAFGALGGDFSSLNINPAGSAVFNNNQVAFTLTNFNTENKSNYFGTKTIENNASFDLNQIGGVFVFDDHSEKSNWKKLTLAMNYENVNNFDNSLYSEGTNPTNSIDSYFLHFANQNGGIMLSDLKTLPNETLSDLYGYLGSNYGFGAQQALLGYQGFIIDPVDSENPNNNSYISLVPAGGNYYQKNSFESTGYNGKLSFNAATQYKDYLYFGLNLNAHFTDYTQLTSFYEKNSNNENSGVQRLRFDNELYTYGTGFSFQLGAIAKVTKEIRFGIAYESPTWYELNDELAQGLAVVSADAAGEIPTDFVNPQVINIYAPYKLQTPSKWTGSFAYIFGKSGLLSIDYALKDYSKTQYEQNEDFRSVNNSMSNLLDNTGELRIGGEYKIKQWSLRGGYRFEKSPYKDGKTMGDLTGYSAGLGYNFGATRLDLAYSQAQREYQKQFFSQGLTDSAKINALNENLTLTLVFEL